MIIPAFSVIALDIRFSAVSGQGIVLEAPRRHDREREDGLQTCQVSSESEAAVSDLHRSGEVADIPGARGIIAGNNSVSVQRETLPGA